MESSVQESNLGDRKARLFGIVFAIAFTVLLFGVYPLGLLPQQTSVKVRAFYDAILFFISVPLFVTLSAVFFLAKSFVDRHRYWLPLPIGASSLVLAIVTNIPAGWSNLSLTALILGCVTFPLLVLVARDKGWLTRYGVSRVGFIVWTIQVSLGYMAIFHNRPMYGVSSNPRWAIVFLLLLSPWAVIGAFHKYPKFHKSKWFTIIFGAHVTIMPIVKYRSIGVTLRTEPFSFFALVLTLLLIFLFFKLNHRTERMRLVMGCVAIGWTTVYLIAKVVLGGFPVGLHQPFRVDTWHNNLSYGLSVPAFLTLGLLAVPVIATHRWRVAKPLLVGVVIYVASWLVNYPRHTEFVDEFVMILGCLSIPLAAAILRERGIMTLPRISRVCFIVWTVQITLGFVAVFTGQPVVGTPGNPNWLAAILLALAPWAVCGLVQKHERFHKSKWFRIIFLAHVIVIPAFNAKTYLDYSRTHTGALLVLALTLALIFLFFAVKYPNGLAIWLAATGVVAIPTLFLLSRCHSRAGMLALFGTPVLLLFVVFKTRLEKALYAGLLVIAVAGTLLILFRFFPSVLLDVVEPDVRLPLWSGTVAMMVDHPLGVRPGEYQRRFVKYRIGTYHSRLVAADMTIHPHNELLNLGAQLGFPALIALILMVLPLIGGGFDDPLITLARLSAFVMVIASCFDMPLVQPPVSFLGFAMIGLCWPLTLKPTIQAPWRCRTAIATFALVVCTAATFIWFDLVHDCHFRRGTIQRHAAKAAQAANNMVAARSGCELAYESFIKAATPFDSLRANYEAGVLKFNAEEYAKAEELLLKVQELDPAYAHLNMILGQLYFKQQKFVEAQRHFLKECHYYQKNTGVWQNMYAFAFSSAQFGLAQFCDAQLRGLYLEKARRTYRGDMLDAKRRMFLETLSDESRRKESITRGKELGRNVSLTVLDPLMHVLALGESWHKTLLEGSYEKFDYLLWLGRYRKYTLLREAFPEKAPDVKTLTTWFCKRYTVVDSDEFIVPTAVSKRRKAGPSSIYACFSDYVSIIGSRCLLQLDANGVPEFAWVFSGPLRVDNPRDPKTGKVSLTPIVDVSKIDWYKVDLKRGTCQVLDAVQARKSFSWIPDRTVAYFAPEEYFLRTQILGVIMADEAAFLPTRPPSIRLLELFWITGKTVPGLFALKNYCFQEPLVVYKALYQQAVDYANSKKTPEKK